MHEFQGKDLSSLSVVVLRHSIEARLGFGRDGLKVRRHEISDLARKLAEQLCSPGPLVLASVPVAVDSPASPLQPSAQQRSPVALFRSLLRATAPVFVPVPLLRRVLAVRSAVVLYLSRSVDLTVKRTSILQRLPLGLRRPAVLPVLSQRRSLRCSSQHHSSSRNSHSRVWVRCLWWLPLPLVAPWACAPSSSSKMSRFCSSP